ncbi:hypothetical protein [Mucilaginibacter frigoritolerans]|uniref:hypothetical protein n=1 Tax=Mucilaginibacter frigoritolerans TaxID=652788 RepID=UPI001477196E|nr:hypothetical protein [Mucilaginibacter frigoritolerans]
MLLAVEMKGPQAVCDYDFMVDMMYVRENPYSYKGGSIIKQTRGKNNGQYKIARW